MAGTGIAILILVGILVWFLTRKKEEGDEPKVGLKWNSGPPFYVGSTHTATVTLRNPTARDWVYRTTLESAAPIAFTGQLWTDTPVAAGATVTLTRDVVMLGAPVVSPACRVMVTETTTGEWWLFEFEGITLEEEAVPAVEVGLYW